MNWKQIKERYLKWRYPLMPTENTVVRVMLSREEFARILKSQTGVASDYIQDESGEQHSLGFYTKEFKRVKFRRGMFASVVTAGKKGSWIKIFDHVLLINNNNLK